MDFKNQDLHWKTVKEVDLRCRSNRDVRTLTSSCIAVITPHGRTVDAEIADDLKSLKMAY